MNRYDKQSAIAQQYFSAEMLENGPIKPFIRDMKIKFLDKFILDHAYHRRYWVISFHEKWVDAEREQGSYPHQVMPGDKVFRLHGSIMEADRQDVALPIYPKYDYETWRLPQELPELGIVDRLYRWWNTRGGES